MTAKEFIEKWVTSDSEEFKTDLKSVIETAISGFLESDEYKADKTEEEHVADLLNSFSLIEPTDSDTKHNHRIVLEVFCAWLVGRRETRPDNWDVDIFLADGAYNNLMQGKAIPAAESDRDEILECLVDVFYQSCMQADGKFDNQLLSAYESAQELLIRLGKIKESDCYRK